MAKQLTEADIDNMSEAELDAFLAQSKKQITEADIDNMSEAELDAFLAQNANPATKQAQRELIDERVAREKAAIEQRYQDETTLGDKIGAGVGAALMGAGQMMNPLTPFVEKVAPGSAFDASQELTQASEEMPIATNIGRAAGFVGSAITPAALGKMGATIPTTLGQSALKVGAANAAIGGGITAINEAPGVLKGEESLGSAATDVATSALVSGALGAGGQKLANKLASSVSDDIQNAATRTVRNLTPQKRSDFVEAASKFGVDPQELSDDILKLEQGGTLSKNSPLANFYTVAKNKVFEGVNTAQEADLKLARLALDGGDDISRGVAQIPKEYRADLVMPEILSEVIDTRVGKSSMGATGAEYLDEFKTALDKLGMPARAKQVLLSQDRQRLTAQEVQDLQRVLQNKLSDFYKLDKNEVIKAKEGLKLLADVRNKLASTLEDVGGPGVREGNEKVHAALMMRDALKNSDKAFSKEGFMQATWRRVSGALTPIGAKLAVPRAVLDQMKAEAPIPVLTSLQGPTRLTRNLSSITQFLNQPQVIQNLAPQDAEIVKQFLNLPEEQQKKMAPLAIKAIESSGFAQIDPPQSGFASEVDGVVTDPADQREIRKLIQVRSDISAIEKAKIEQALNKEGKIPVWLIKKGNVEMEIAPDYIRTKEPMNEPINLSLPVEEAMQRVTKPKRRY